MKQLYILLAIVFTTYSVQAQLGVDTYELGEDNANNYPGASWTTTSQGTGFSDWTFDTALPGGGFAGRFIGSFSTALDVSGNSFGLFANSGNGAVSGATVDMPKTLEEGDSFTVSVGVNFRDGNKGFDIRNSSNATIINFNVGGDTYNVTGTSNLFSNAYDANTVFTFTFTQNATDVSWTVVRSGGLSGTQSGTIGSISPGTMENVRFYNVSAGTNGDGGSGQRNLYLNSLEFNSTYTIAENSTVNVTANTTAPYLDIQSGSTLNITAGNAVTVSGDFDNNGSVNLSSTSTTYSSLIVNGTASGNVTYNRFVNSNSLGNDLIAPPVDGQAWSSFLDPVNATALLDGGGAPTVYAFAPFDKVTGVYTNYTTSTSTTLDVGTGYRAATDSGETLAFTGTVETGTVSVNIENSGPTEQEWNLIGNPYPAYLNVQDFLNHEVSAGVSNIQLFESGTAGIYGYDGNVADGWVVYNLATTTASTVIAPGQGFFVSANASQVSAYDVEFTAAMRSTGTTDDFIAGRNAQLTYLKLNIGTANKSYKTEFYVNDNSSLGLDLGYDATVWGGTAPEFAIYSHLVEDNDGKQIALQSISSADLNDVTIPLGVNAAQGEQLRFSILESTLPESTKVYLEDTAMNTTTLLNTSDYVITPSSNLSGTGRFFLRTSEDALSINENGFDSLQIYTSNATKELIINGQISEDASVELYDIQGRLIFTSQLDSTTINNHINTATLSAGVYVVNVQNNTHQKSQKIIIK